MPVLPADHRRSLSCTIHLRRRRLPRMKLVTLAPLRICSPRPHHLLKAVAVPLAAAVPGMPMVATFQSCQSCRQTTAAPSLALSIFGGTIHLRVVCPAMQTNGPTIAARWSICNTAQHARRRSREIAEVRRAQHRWLAGTIHGRWEDRYDRYDRPHAHSYR